MSVSSKFEQLQAARLAALRKKERLARAREIMSRAVGLYSYEARYTSVGPDRRVFTAGWENMLENGRRARERMDMEDRNG